jgi:6-phospho-3-hexuloisomerase
MKYENEILNEIKMVLDSINEEDVDELVEAILDSDKVVGYGAGRMGLSLKAFMMRLNHLGIQAHYVDDTYIPPLTEFDLIIVSSGSGETTMVKTFFEKAIKVSGCKTAAITGNGFSSMGKAADYLVTFKPCNGGLNSEDNPNKISSIQLMSTLNEQATYILFDIMAKKIADRLNLNTEKTKRNHFNVE